jgi:hypothetical protein
MRNRIIGLLAASLAVSLAGCGDVEQTGFLSLSQVSGIAIEEDGCGAPDKTLVPPLSYDAGAGMETGSEYLLGLWLQNGLVANDDTDGTSTGRTNTNRVQVQRIEVQFTDRETWGFLPESIEVGMPFVVDSEAEIGWPTELLPLYLAKDLVENPASPIRDTGSQWVSLPIRVKAKGELLDGTAVESNEFDLNLSVCNACLFRYACGPDGHSVCLCPVGTEAKGCRFGQGDLFTCEEVQTEPAQ